MSKSNSMLCILALFLCSSYLIGCSTNSQSKDKMMVGKIQGTDADEEAIYNILSDLKNYISTSQWDAWLDLYSDDAVLTLSNRKVDKIEMRREVQGITYIISEMEILKKNIGDNEATVSVRFIGNSKTQYETYKFRKYGSKWLIVEETNP